MSHRTFGLIGYPIKHSLSPVMHNAAFKAHGIDADYRLFEVAPEQIDYFFAHLSKTECAGFNVTIPYKEKVIGFIPPADDAGFLKKIGAMNTIVRRSDEWVGYNTDITGFLKHFREYRDPSGKRAAVLGAGGASRAVCYSLGEAGIADIALYDLDAGKVRALVAMLKELFPQLSVSAAGSVEALDLRGRDFLINATPVGMRPTDAVLVGDDFFHRDLFVYDVIYNPAVTGLLRNAGNAGCQTANGLGMLLYQGTRAFELFTGCTAPVDAMRNALAEGIKDI
jgi:shikimate dehydrogenase